ncbi:MAG: tripartite tricarboxylate transporter permease [Thermoflexales bacterium]|nr:tripartite tricarboxylate transporter permease [Thermoflexales bacterium]MDW8350930.1 tripartite tricarboxylate transporter permease [Anaerolineae bacterium]
MANLAADLTLLGIALAGALVGCGLALLPGLHVFNVAGLALALSARDAIGLADQALAMFLLGALVGWAMVNVIPAVFLFAPDDANVIVVLPTTKYLMRGRGAEAVMLVGAGSLGALVGLVLLSPLLDEVLRPLRAIIQPHTGWMLVAIIAFLLLGEWPRADDLAPPMRRLASAWGYLGAGLLTFVLSGLLGFVLFYRSPIAVESAFVNLMPAFIGLFAVPGLLQILLFGAKPPPQITALPAEIEPRLLLRGSLTGLSGGLFAAVLPVVTGGIGGLLAGHATAQWNDRLFMISLGASKVAYYVGSLLLLFVPGLTLTRGGMAWMLSSVYVPYGWRSYWLAVAGIALAGAVAFVVLVVLARAAAKLVSRLDVKWIAVGSLGVAVVVTLAFTGAAGLIIMLVATTVGLIPVIVGGRRLNCLGVLLLPITLNVIGVGPAVARWLGLL